MSEDKLKSISLTTEVVVKKAPECKEIKFKASANLTEEELLKKHTIGEFSNDEADV